MHTSQAVFASYSPLTLPNKQLVLHPYLGLPCLAFFFTFVQWLIASVIKAKKLKQITDIHPRQQATGNWARRPFLCSGQIYNDQMSTVWPWEKGWAAQWADLSAPCHTNGLNPALGVYLSLVDKVSLENWTLFRLLILWISSALCIRHTEFSAFILHSAIWLL